MWTPNSITEVHVRRQSYEDNCFNMFKFCFQIRAWLTVWVWRCVEVNCALCESVRACMRPCNHVKGCTWKWLEWTTIESIARNRPIAVTVSERFKDSLAFCIAWLISLTQLSLSSCMEVKLGMNIKSIHSRADLWYHGLQSLLLGATEPSCSDSMYSRVSEHKRRSETSEET